MKGEAGVLGLDDLQAVCHATEDFLEGRGVSGPGLGNHRFGIGEQVRIHQKRPSHGYLKMPW